MNTIKGIGITVGKVAIAFAFMGLGILGLALMGMVVWYPVDLIKAIPVFLLGLFGFLIAVGYGHTLRNRVPNHSVGE